jgi:23S rRNA pseudouridine2604 synthase
MEDKSLNKHIAETGICSRREADTLIESKRVTINGVVAQKGNRVTEADVVKIDGRPLKAKKKTVYLAFNKPRGVTCTTDLKDPCNIIDFLGYPDRIFPIGRLDKDSDGLIFLTNDGDIVNKILRAGNQHDKEYEVTVDRYITPEFIARMSKGVRILGTLTKPCVVVQERSRMFRIILQQGLNRQIRRMCSELGYTVQSLRRVRIMHIELKQLPQGKWRNFTPAEIDKMNTLVLHSKKTADTPDADADFGE